MVKKIIYTIEELKQWNNNKTKNHKTDRIKKEYEHTYFKNEKQYIKSSLINCSIRKVDKINIININLMLK